MSKYRYGLASIIVSEIDATGAPVNPVDVTQYVYKDTLELIEAEGNITKHFAEGFTVPSVALKETGETVGKFSLFGYPLSLLETFKGGTATIAGDPAKTTYEKPNQEVQIERHIVVTTKDNVRLTYKRAFIDSAKESKINDKDVDMLKVTFIPLLPADGTSPEVIEEL